MGNPAPWVGGLGCNCILSLGLGLIVNPSNPTQTTMYIGLFITLKFSRLIDYGILRTSFDEL